MPPTTYRDGGRTERLAKEAADAYLATKADLSEKIASISTREVLNGDQVLRVVNRANHLVHEAMRAHGPVVEFDIARTDKIAACRPRPASDFISVEKAAGGPTGEAFTKAAGETDDFWNDPVASRQRHQSTTARVERAELELGEAKDAKVMADDRLTKAAFAFRQSLLDYGQEGGDLAQAMESIANRPKVAAEPELLFSVASLMKKVGAVIGSPVTFTERTMSVMTDDAERKKTAEAVEPDLIAAGLHMSGMPVAILNGEHQVWRDLDTLVDQYHHRALCVRGIADAQDKVEYVRGPARARYDAAVHQAGRPV